MGYDKLLKLIAQQQAELDELRGSKAHTPPTSSAGPGNDVQSMEPISHDQFHAQALGLTEEQYAARKAQWEAKQDALRRRQHFAAAQQTTRPVRMLTRGFVPTLVLAIVATLFGSALEDQNPVVWFVFAAVAVSPLAMTAVMARRCRFLAEKRDWLRLWLALALGVMVVAASAVIGSLTGIGGLRGAALGAACSAPWWALTSVFTASWTMHVEHGDRRWARVVRTVAALAWTVPVVVALDGLVTLLGVQR